ncbi:SpoIIE family protein phosphatase [Puniceicoccales bacterium CK1056]|uniref:SpoIIE family protein phosphatase n=1 Tax=Oceanipulchritudo coccoides TaxID=2706888 RepID=A0A6B2M5S5_9BACT|nr:GAF domain-containing SpoIIE family protein phosphatase [Oceanipulchritudo coccoides]NDV63509.1 SpoIIE family protein phosphatase [Oceanipulchritudo coccoides]
MLLVFFFGLALGTGIGWFFWWTARRENTRLDEQRQMLAQEKLIVFDFVHNMVEAIGEGVTRQELFERVVHAAILSTGALSACIFECEGDRIRGVSVEGLFPPHRPLPPSSRVKITTRAKFIEQILKSEVFKIGEGLVGTAAQSGKGILIENALEDPRIIKHDDPALEVRSVIVVPILFRDRNIGVLAMVNPSDGGSFGETDFSLAQSLAEQAGLAIHNLDLMASQIEKNKLDSDLGLAHEIQSMLLPKEFPAVPNLEMATIYKPAQKVGGDLYDIFPIDENRVGIAIADVSGKGIPASLLMAICQSNLRHFARHMDSPARVLSELNEVMVGETRPEMFVTIIYAVVDLAADEIVFARGGHELPIIVHSADNAPVAHEFLQSEGMALGMVPNEIFDMAIQDLTIPFKKGDILALYTDGVTEAVNVEGVEFGNSRLAEVVSTLRARTSEDLVSGILDRISLFSGDGDGQVDDFTVVIAKHL